MPHQESVVVPESMEISDERRQQLNNILQKDNFGVDIFKESLEFWCITSLKLNVVCQGPQTVFKSNFEKTRLIIKAATAFKTAQVN
ncbi:hypothetical protein DPMN_160209 [Dreissena polymorpha]|uniref:Uncharacterized protein n=1 Tax=Dreissena polymorpha TaxID=45954 RepID=A0A9D4EME5_DREPO|nr:hypothetical protein DPMN_160209 [Dreissena polymorpha]